MDGSLNAVISRAPVELIKLSCSNTLDIIAIYRSQEEYFVSVENHLQIMVDLEKNTLIVGDLNFCYLKKENALSKYLAAEGFNQFVMNPTHINGGRFYSNVTSYHN